MKKEMERNNVLFYGDLDKQTKEQNNYKLLLIPLIIGLILFIIINNVYTNKAIENCVEKGHDHDYCLVKLS